MDFPDFKSAIEALEHLTKTPREQPSFHCGYCGRWEKSGHECGTPLPAFAWEKPTWL